MTLALALPAGAEATAPGRVTLITPQGQPIGGQWQAWVDEAQVPTITGTLTITSNTAMGCPARGCSVSPNALEAIDDTTLAADWTTTETGLARDARQWDLYYELGHQFDWADLTPASRQQFLSLWHIPAMTQWWDSLAGLAGVPSTEDGAEATFAGAYADCAMGVIVGAGAAGFPQAPMIASTEGTCALINQLGPSQAPTVSRVTVIVGEHVRRHGRLARHHHRGVTAGRSVRARAR